MGLLGILTAKLLHASGCSVVGVEINPERIKKAKQLQIDTFSPAEIHKNISALTRGRGFDHVFICADTQSNETVELAGEIARDRAKIVAIGAVGMDIPRKIYYEKELVFMVSRSYGPGRYDPSYEEHGHDYPEGFVRWTEGRNLEAVTDLMASGKLDVEPLITHTFPIDQALDAYAMINDDGRDDYLGIIITYPETDHVKKITVSSTHEDRATETLNIGVLGAGNYANAFFLPIISKSGDCQIHTIVSGRGLNAQQSAKRFGAKAAASDEDAVFDNSDIDAVAILSRHNLHADQVIKALRSGKHIYCEKPLALTKKDTARIASQLKKDGHPYLAVGFNRRFAPYSIKLKSFFEDRTEPMVVNYRVNAGFIPPTHWLHDTTIGGGRLIGEACHFIDYVLFLTDSIPVSISTVMMANADRYSNDNLVISIEMEDGSIASITYAANGSRQQGKEYIEVFCQGKSGVIDNFRSITLFDGKKHHTRTFFSQDKGHRQSWKSFVDAIKSNGSPPVAYPQLLYSTYAALAAEESRRTRTAIAIEEFIHNK